MTAEITQADYDAAAELADRAEAVAFSGNDIAALRLGIAGDGEILGFVRLVAQVRTQARDTALEESKTAVRNRMCEQEFPGPSRRRDIRELLDAIDAPKTTPTESET